MAHPGRDVERALRRSRLTPRQPRPPRTRDLLGDVRVALAAAASPYGLDLRDDSHAGPTTLPFARYGHRTRTPVLRRPLETSQYTSFLFQQELDDHRVLQSIGSVGDAYDNAMAESFVDTFKTELIADRVWRTRSQLELAIVEWVAWFNTTRLHESLGDVPPAEFEDLYARQSDHFSPSPT